MLEFFILTPLPGSEDHQKLHKAGVWMDPDMNKYDVEHVATGHALMSKSEWEGAYRSAWELYYSPQHIERILRRGKASGIRTSRLVNHVMQFSFTFRQEKVHPLQGGFFRRKLRRHRRFGLPRENPLRFYPRRVWEVIDTNVRLLAFFVHLQWLRRRIERDPTPYVDAALIMPVQRRSVDGSQSDRSARPVAITPPAQTDLFANRSASWSIVMLTVAATMIGLLSPKFARRRGPRYYSRSRV
jgi:hypothetical protein